MIIYIYQLSPQSYEKRDGSGLRFSEYRPSGGDTIERMRKRHPEITFFEMQVPA